LYINQRKDSPKFLLELSTTKAPIILPKMTALFVSNFHSHFFLTFLLDISTDNVNKSPLTTFTESANHPLTHGYFSRDYHFTVPANSHFFEIRFKPWTNIRGINYWTPQVAHVEFDEVCDPASVCGNGICEETCISCPQVNNEFFHFSFFQDCGVCKNPVCGNGACEFGESWSDNGCDADCGTIVTCGNWKCEAGEACGASTRHSCSADCCNGTLGFRAGTCGDGSCNGAETCSTCSRDCGACPLCGDGQCNGAETCGNCPGDCGNCNACNTGTTGVASTTGSTSTTTGVASTTGAATTGVASTTGGGSNYIDLIPIDGKIE
jgi:hypothetical protein